jgi:hypothetical protein
MFVCIEFREEYDSATADCFRGAFTKYVDNVYGPFPTLEAAEKFRLNHESPEDCDCFLLQSPEESS